MPVTLTRARETDAPRLLDFVAAYYAFDGLPFHRPEAEAALRQLIGDDSLGRVWRIDVDAEPAGYVVLTLGYSLEYGGRDAFIDEFYLAAPFRGRGGGQRALALVEEEARALGVRVLHLEVERRNAATQALYRRAGFEDHDRILMTRWLV